MNTTRPTDEAYGELSKAFDYFNERLFGGELPPCLITVVRHRSARGYYSPKRFQKGDAAADEIAMNPDHMKSRPDREALSTLVHEMCHHWQFAFGKPSRSNYHNKEWGSKMDAVGLEPTSTGLPGGKRTGQSVTHFIKPGGAFDVACAELLRSGFALSWGSAPVVPKTGKSGKRFAYQCPTCEAKVWGKSGLRIECKECEEIMRGSDDDGADNSDND